MSYRQFSIMAYTSKAKTATTADSTSTETKKAVKAFYSLGALFETSSEALPLVGKPDPALIEALGLVPEEGKEWKIFVSAKTSKAGKPYLSAYLGQSDIRR
jgi:hypothetical protein